MSETSAAEQANSPSSAPRGLIHSATQVMLPSLTIGGFLLTSLKLPSWGLLISLAAQIFWLYAGYKAWKKAGQVGIFISSIVLTIIILGGVINYWILG